MSERWEKSIVDWYNNSRTVNLEYLDLAETEKPQTKHVYHNLAVIYDRINLQSRVVVKNLKQIRENLEKQERRIENLEKAVQNLTSTFVENRPLTKEEVRRLVFEIAQQPKLVEQEALKLTESLNSKIKRVEDVVKRLESWSAT